MKIFANKFGVRCIFDYKFDFILCSLNYVQLLAYRSSIFSESFIFMKWIVICSEIHIVHQVKPNQKSNFSKFRMRFYCASFHLPKWINGNAHTFHRKKISLFDKKRSIILKRAWDACGTGITINIVDTIFTIEIQSLQFWMLNFDLCQWYCHS